MTEAAAQLSGASIAEQKEQYIGLVNELNSLRDHIRGLDELLEIQINRLRESHRESYSESYETTTCFPLGRPWPSPAFVKPLSKGMRRPAKRRLTKT